MNKLSKREKWLIYILACLIVLSGGFYFFIEPILIERSNVIDELNFLELTAKEMEIKINAADTIAEEIEQTKTILDEITDEFYPLMSNVDIDRLISGILSDNGLTPTGLVVSSSGTSDTDMGYIQSKYINVNVTGSMEGLLGVLDYASNEKALRIVTFSINGGEDGSISMNIDFEVFMYAANDEES